MKKKALTPDSNFYLNYQQTICQVLSKCTNNGFKFHTIFLLYTCIWPKKYALPKMWEAEA